MLGAGVVVAPVLGLGALLFDMDVASRNILAVIVLVGSGIFVAYAVVHFRDGGTFCCRLTEEQLFQSVPVPALGESFQIKLSQVIRIEIHDGGGEISGDEWYVHTEQGRYRITSNYGNPYRKFGAAIQKALPHVETIRT